MGFQYSKLNIKNIFLIYFLTCIKCRGLLINTNIMLAVRKENNSDIRENRDSSFCVGNKAYGDGDSIWTLCL